MQGTLKTEIMADMEKYVVKDDALAMLLDRMHANGVKTFLLTNSGFEYSNVCFLIRLLVIWYNIIKILLYVNISGYFLYNRSRRYLFLQLL